LTRGPSAALASRSSPSAICATGVGIVISFRSSLWSGHLDV